MISDAIGTARGAIVRIYGAWMPTYVDGNIHDIFINDITCNEASKAVIIAGVPHDSAMNKIVVNNSATPVDNLAVTPTFEQANFTVTNIIEND